MADQQLAPAHQSGALNLGLADLGATDPLAALVVPERITQDDLDRLSAYAELRKKERESIIDGQIKLSEHKKERIQSYIRMGLSFGVAVMGAIFVLNNQHDMGFLLLGGGLGSITTNVPDIMKATKGKGNEFNN